MRGDGNCGFYAAMEGLLIFLISVTTDVKSFRKEVHDYIDMHRNEVLVDFYFSVRLHKDRTIRGRERDDWIEKDVMKRIW